MFAYDSIAGAYQQTEVPVGSLAACRAYLTSIFHTLGHRDDIGGHYVQLGIGKTFYQTPPDTPADATTDDGPTAMLSKLTKLRQQFSTGPLTGRHADAARTWCRAHTFVMQQVLKKTTLHVAHTVSAMHSIVTFYYDDDNDDDDDDLGGFRWTVEATPQRLEFVSMRAPREDQLEYRVAFKARPQLDEAGLGSARDEAGVDDDAYRVTSVRFEDKKLWASADHVVALDHVMQQWPDEDATFWTIQMQNPEMETHAWGVQSDRADEFVEAVLRLASDGEQLVAALNAML
ncbi:Aste57867_3974 [Aphanomyces stellatus]|uniref:Aste57867_3974 protein n=1 Tax=Aphanomyces stellatus TaxID=120398 RepID=A0A485KD37_9STRA|nr:hypothetical protein As57867_003963 [Aphanomyces stellatus]VFT81111.1 Aste57867_3974 [Aphanomyces stellatus]